jgi:dipeptidase
MCDTLVTVTDGGLMFAKNSDRDANEAQGLEWVAAADHRIGERVRCTWIDIPQVAHTEAVLLSRPWWMWGAEIGTNEHGVVIGNEAVFTRGPYGDRALLGMDLLRLALERSRTAREAVAVIVELLERHGQGGPCSHRHPGFTYDNSFLVADPGGALVVETAGREWATEEVAGPGRSISNGLSIPGFARAHADRLRTWVASAAIRCRRTREAAARAAGPADLMAALRDHGDAASPRWSTIHGGLGAACAHAGGVLASSQTTASWVSDLRAGPRHWATATSAPCTSLFKPVRVDTPVDLGPGLTDRYDGETLWWRHELLHRESMADHAALIPRYRDLRDETERRWIDSPPSPGAAFDEADRLERAWLTSVRAAGARDTRPAWVRREWRALDREAELGGARVERELAVSSRPS